MRPLRRPTIATDANVAVAARPPTRTAVRRIAIDVHAVRPANRPFTGRSANAANATGSTDPGNATNATGSTDPASTTDAASSTDTSIDHTARTADSAVVVRARVLLAGHARCACQGEQRE